MISGSHVIEALSSEDETSLTLSPSHLIFLLVLYHCWYHMVRVQDWLSSLGDQADGLPDPALQINTTMTPRQTPLSFPQDPSEPRPAPGCDYSSHDLRKWYYPQATPVNPFTTIQTRVSLLSALEIGNDPISPPNRIPHQPSPSKKDAPNLDAYLEGFTVPWYGQEWDYELEQKPANQREIQVPNIDKPMLDPFQPTGNPRLQSRTFADRKLLNRRKRDWWDVRIWGYQVQSQMKANQPTLYFGKVFIITIIIIWRQHRYDLTGFFRVLHSRLAPSSDE